MGFLVNCPELAFPGRESSFFRTTIVAKEKGKKLPRKGSSEKAGPEAPFFLQQLMGRVRIEHPSLEEQPGMGIAICQEGGSSWQGTDGVLGFAGIRAAPVGTMGIAAQEVDQAPVIEPADAAEGPFPEIPGEAAQVALEQDALFHPLADCLGLLHDAPVPFRMGQDGQIAPELELVEQVPGFQGSSRGQEFHQEIGSAGQAVFPVFPGTGQIVQGVCIQAHLRPAVEADGNLGLISGLLELGQPFRDGIPRGTDAPAVEMGRSEQVGSPSRRCLPEHLQRHSFAAGAIVPVDVG